MWLNKNTQACGTCSKFVGFKIRSIRSNAFQVSKIGCFSVIATISTVVYIIAELFLEEFCLGLITRRSSAAELFVQS